MVTPRKLPYPSVHYQRESSHCARGAAMALAKGTVQLGVGVDAALLERVKDFAEGRSETMRHVVETALRRHMAYPPPRPEDAPFPPDEVLPR